MSYNGRFYRRKRRNTKALTLLLALVLLCGAVTGTLAYLSANTDGITNTFTTAEVPNTPEEKFDGTTKTEIKVKVDGNIAAYVRVKLVTYRVNDEGDRIGGVATIPNFTLGENWFEKNGYYYYSLPVQPGASSGNLLGTSISLQEYTDADGGKQVIEVISESIQSVPASTVESVWKVTVDANGNLTYGSYAGGIVG